MSRGLRWLGLLWAVLAVVMTSVGTTTVSASTFTYDAHAIARSDTQAVARAETSPAQLRAAPKGSAAPSTAPRGTSTTPIALCVATEAATVRHYTTAEAAESITKAGKTIPGSSSGKTWLTPDEYLDGATAQSKLALNKTPDGYFEIPMCRVSCPSSPSRVQPYNGQPGGGIEITTNSTIDVTGLPFIPFGPR